MTTKEKASRYDALQLAIDMTVRAYENIIKDYPPAECVGNNIILAAQYGEKLAYLNAITDMRRWLA